MAGEENTKDYMALMLPIKKGGVQLLDEYNWLTERQRNLKM
jgi:hypothetical protein